LHDADTLIDSTIDGSSLDGRLPDIAAAGLNTPAGRMGLNRLT
jgi:hypothetical protein